MNENSMTLTGVSEHTDWFSDRPERLAGQVVTADFVSLWDEGDNSFADDPPNADFTCQVNGETLNRVVELRSPDLDSMTLTHSTIGVDEVGATVISECDGNAHLFIDGWRTSPPCQFRRVGSHQAMRPVWESILKSRSSVGF